MGNATSYDVSQDIQIGLNLCIIYNKALETQCYVSRNLPRLGFSAAFEFKKIKKSLLCKI